MKNYVYIVGGKNVCCYCNGSLAVASRLSITPDSVFSYGNIEGVYIVGLAFRQNHVSYTSLCYCM